MSTVPTEPSAPSDAELITSVRNGALAAYGTLYERHVSAAYNLARQLSRSSAEADDLVSEAFSKVLDTLRAGKGPDSAFRAYLLTALRHTAYDKTRKDRRVELSDDMSEATGALGSALTVPFSDTAVAGLERSLAAKAFARLPERWQAVLWHTEIEQQSPAEVAPILGLTPNSVSALAYRAREGLRQAYLQVHLAETTAARCRATTERLGAWTRDGLSKRERVQVETHLDECEQCRALAAELADVNGAMRLVIAPLVLGGAVLGYLATAGAGKASAAAAGMAATSTGVAAATAGGAGGSSGGAAAAAGPRQFLGVAASGAAIAAAVAVGLTAGGGPDTPIAVQPQADAPAVEAPADPTPPDPAEPESEPEPDVPPPPPPPAPPEEEAALPPVPEPVQTPQVEPPPAEVPSPADISATPPEGGVDLIAGGDPVDLPITVRNDGEEKSEPVTVTLSLPAGVNAVAANGGGSQPMSARAAAPRTQQQRANPDTVRCPGGNETVECSTPDGLEPGESVILMFRLSADHDAQPGEITGTVSGGSMGTFSLRVPVQIAEQRDGVALHVTNAGPLLRSTISNTGESTKHATLIIDAPASVPNWADNRRIQCETDEQRTTCTTSEPMAPGEHLVVRTLLRHQVHHRDDVTVTARIGSAQDTVTVSNCFRAPPCEITSVPTAPPTETTTMTVPPETATHSARPTETHWPPSTRPSPPGHSVRPDRTTTDKPGWRTERPSTQPGKPAEHRRGGEAPGFQRLRSYFTPTMS